MMRQIKSFITNRFHIYTLILIFLIIVHGRFENYFIIDHITLILLLLLFILPYTPLIRKWKFKYGDLEAEITTDDVKAIENQLNQISKKEQPVNKERTFDLVSLAETDPQLALAKVRIEIEKQLRLLFQIYLKENVSHSSRLSPKLVVESLKKRDIIEQPLANALQDIISVANRAIHGEEITTRNALSLIKNAEDALFELELIIIDHALKSAKTKVIPHTTVEDYLNAEYMLTTITPLIKNPKKNTYTVNQAELDAFFAGYDEFSEFVINLERIDKKSK